MKALTAVGCAFIVYTGAALAGPDSHSPFPSTVVSHPLLLASADGNSSWYSSATASIELSQDCDAAEQEASRLVQGLGAEAQQSDPSICESAHMSRKSGEIGLKLASRCEGRPGNDELAEQMKQMIRQADATISGSCN